MSVIGRNTQGVRLIRTVEGEHVVALQRIDEIEEPAESELVEGVEGDVTNASEQSISSEEHNAQQDDSQAPEDDSQE